MAAWSLVLPLSTSAEKKVPEGNAEVAQPSTVHAFTGQGIGMDLDLYNSSTVARVVWDSADAQLISAYDFSIGDRP